MGRRAALGGSSDALILVETAAPVTPNYLAALSAQLLSVAAELERDAARLPGRRSVYMSMARHWREDAKTASLQAQVYVAPGKEWAT